MEYIVGIVILIFAITVYFISYTANEQTEIPEGLEERYNEAQTCSGCHAKSEMLIPEDIVFEFKEENNL